MIVNSSRLVAAFVWVIFLLLLATGTLAQVSNEIERVSVSSIGVQGNNQSGISYDYPVSLSSDGRFVVFVSDATNLAPVGNTNNGISPGLIYMHDRHTGLTELISVTNSGYVATRNDTPVISADGRLVFFSSQEGHLLPNFGVTEDIFVRDRQTSRTELISVSGVGARENGNLPSYGPAITPDGRFVVFFSFADNLISGDTNFDGGSDVFVRDRLAELTERVNVSSTGVQANHHDWTGYFLDSQPAISVDGRFIAFLSTANNLIPGDTNGFEDVLVHDRQNNTLERVNVSSGGFQANCNPDKEISMSADGRLIAFASCASNLVPDDIWPGFNVFVHDRQTGLTENISISNTGDAVNGWQPTMSADGRYVAFISTATELVPRTGEQPYPVEVFVRDLQAGITELVSISGIGAYANEDSISPSMSADGCFIAFTSSADNLVPGDTNGYSDVFVARNVLHTDSDPRITDISFTQQRIADLNIWEPVNPHTVDGNLVRIRVSIQNSTCGNQTLDVQFTDNEQGTPLRVFDLDTNTAFNNGIATLNVPSGFNNFDFLWDTSGYAWNNNHTPHSNRQVKASLFLNGDEVSIKTSAIKVVPKPIIFVHGWNSDASTWDEFEDRVSDFNPDWQTFAVDTMLTNKVIARNKNIAENSQALDTYIRQIREDTNAAQVDIVAHSFGGVISRYYIDSQNLMGTIGFLGDSKPFVHRLMMLGTPNWGSPCAAGLIAAGGLYTPVSAEMMPFIMRKFNKETQDQRGVPFYILAGGFLDSTCFGDNPGDGVVETISAITGIDPECQIFVPDRGHLGMTSGQDFSAHIMPILAIGPSEAAQAPGCGAASTNSFNTAPPAEDLPVFIVRRFFNIAPGGTASIDIPVNGGYMLGVEITGPGTLLTTALIDPTNTVRSTIDIVSDGYASPVGTHRIGNPDVGTWRLQITNPFGSGVTVVAAAYLRGDPVELKIDEGQSPSPMPALQPDPVLKPLVATLSENSVPIINATVRAEFTDYDGGKTTRSLTHQGAGVYELQNPNLKPGTYWVNLTATTPNWTRMLVTVWIIEADIGPILSYYTTDTPTLTWNRLSWALSYELQVDESDDFSFPLEYSANVDGLEATTTTLSQDVHYWRVRGCSLPGVCGKWSTPERFEVDLP